MFSVMETGQALSVKIYVFCVETEQVSSVRIYVFCVKTGHSSSVKISLGFLARCIVAGEEVHDQLDLHIQQLAVFQRQVPVLSRILLLRRRQNMYRR